MSASPRQVAYEVLRRTFEDDAFTDIAFARAAERAGLRDRDRSQAQRLAYGAVQRRATSDALIERLTSRPVDRIQAPLTAALRLGLYELLFADATPDHAAVNEAVELAKRAGPGRGASLVNAVLRRAVAERSEIVAGFDDSTPEGAAVALSYPLWLAELWWEDLGAESARSLMAAMNDPAETALRVNTLRADVGALAAALAGEGVAPPEGAGLLAPPQALVVDGPIGSETSSRIEAGDLMPQSRASQAVVEVLGAEPGERVLDSCAGPGIKTTAIAAGMGDRGEIVAVEADETRAGRTQELAEALGAGIVRVIAADARSAEVGAGYDRVLVDPPCSDLGTLASRPDARWRKSPAMIERLAALAVEIAAAGASALRPGGTLTYSTCTISQAENEGVVHQLLSRFDWLDADDLGAGNPELRASDPRFLQTRPDRDGTSGFFIARLKRREGGGS
jgi:16S rRNA (cytosine967-C5)-methyltransferase